MALTREQFQKLREKNLSVEQIVAFERGDTPADLQKTTETEQLTAGNQFEQQKPKGFLGKARDFTTGIIGGGKLAEGAGMAIAAPGVRKTIETEQRQTEELQNKLLTRIREKRELGEDTSRLEKALKNSQGLAITLQDVQKDFEEALPTTKEVIGSSLRLATTLGAGAVTRAASKVTALGKATTFLGGLGRGAGAGAISGAITGGAIGTGLGLEANKSSEEILISGLLGAGGGAVLGGAIGSIAGGISGVLKGRAITRENFSKELVSPKLTTKVKAEAIRRGRLEDPGILRKAELQFDRRDKLLASAVDDVVKPKATIGENIDAIRKKITQTNNNVIDSLTKQKAPFNANQLKSKLLTGKEELDLIFASDVTAEKTYNAVVDAFMKNVSKKDTLGLFRARQTFDQIPAVKKLLESSALGENARKEIVLSVRRSANEYVASLLAKGDPFKEVLKNESYMLEALGNLAEKTAKIIGKNKLQILTDEYPLLKWVVGGLVGGSIFAGGVGAGSAIIGSSD